MGGDFIDVSTLIIENGISEVKSMVGGLYLSGEGFNDCVVAVFRTAVGRPRRWLGRAACWLDADRSKGSESLGGARGIGATSWVKRDEAFMSMNTNDDGEL